MIEPCKDCRHCKRLTHTERVWDKDGLHVKTWYTYWCEHINERIKPVIHHEVLELTE